MCPWISLGGEKNMLKQNHKHKRTAISFQLSFRADRMFILGLNNRENNSMISSHFLKFKPGTALGL